MGGDWGNCNNMGKGSQEEMKSIPLRLCRFSTCVFLLLVVTTVLHSIKNENMKCMPIFQSNLLVTLLETPLQSCSTTGLQIDYSTILQSCFFKITVTLLAKS